MTGKEEDGEIFRLRKLCSNVIDDLLVTGHLKPLTAAYLQAEKKRLSS